MDITWTLSGCHIDKPWISHECNVGIKGENSNVLFVLFVTNMAIPILVMKIV